MAERAGPEAMEARIADAFPARQQFATAAGFALRVACPLAGRDMPSLPTALAPRLAVVRATLGAMRPDEFMGAETRRIQHRAGMQTSKTIVAVNKAIDARIVRASQYAKNLQYFYKLEAENEVKLLDVRQNPVPKNTKTLYVGIPYNVNIQGPYKNVMAFLQRLEKGKHFCRINGASFTKFVGTGDGSMTLALSLDLLGQP